MYFHDSNDEGSNKENEETLEIMQEYAQETCSSLLELVCDRKQKTKVSVESKFQQSNLTLSSGSDSRLTSLLESGIRTGNLLFDKFILCHIYFELFQDICQAWIRLYTYSPEAALLKFMQFVLEASGSQYQIPDRLEIPFDFSDILIAATAHFGNVSPFFIAQT